jgi:hypothetical protein
MKGELLLIFICILLGLLIFGVLGGTIFKEGMEPNNSNAVTTLYYGPRGTTAQININKDGSKRIVVNNGDGTTTIFTNNKTGNTDMTNIDPTNTNTSTSTVFIGDNGDTARIMMSPTGQSTLIITKKGGVIDKYTINTNASTNANTNANTNASTNANINTNTSSGSTTDNYDNYNHYDKSSYPTLFYGPDGGTARLIKTPNNNTIVTTFKDGTTQIYYIDNNKTDGNMSIYNGNNGSTAKVITGNNGRQVIEISGPNNSKIVYTAQNNYTYQNQDQYNGTYNPNVNTIGSDYNAAFNTASKNGIQSSTITGPAGNTFSTYDSSPYFNSLPQGISRSQIPPGQEDLYILKSQVVPPVCPACPDPIVKCPSKDDEVNTKCPPCPPCARCPEPAFDCKKVPNYKAVSPSFLPVPVLNDFSSFGM